MNEIQPLFKPICQEQKKIIYKRDIFLPGPVADSKNAIKYKFQIYDKSPIISMYYMW